MGVLVDSETRVVVQGISAGYAQAQTEMMVRYGTKVVAGTRPGRGGQTVRGIPVFDTVKEAVRETGANAAVIYVSAPHVKLAASEALDAHLKLVMVAAEFVPVHDSMFLRARARATGAWMIGPNTIGLIDPRERVLVGTLGPDFAQPGDVAVVSRSGTLSIEVTRLLSVAGIGQSTSVAIGGDLVVGRNPAEYLRLFERDPATLVVVLVGEVGGMREHEAAQVLRSMKKRVVAYVAGASAPPGKRLGHVGAMVTGERETASAKREALQEAGALIAEVPSDIPKLVRAALAGNDAAHR